jgi:hypothetical protein
MVIGARNSLAVRVRQRTPGIPSSDQIKVYPERENCRKHVLAMSTLSRKTALLGGKLPQSRDSRGEACGSCPHRLRGSSFSAFVFII